MFVPGRRFQLSLMFEGKARSLPKSGAPERYLNQVRCSLTCKHYTGMERLARNKHSSFLQTFVNYTCKKFYNIGP